MLIAEKMKLSYFLYPGQRSRATRPARPLGRGVGGVLGRDGVRVSNQLFPAAQMGVGEGKSIGQWYGPNTVAQVLKYVPGVLRLARVSAAEGNEGSLALWAFSGPSEGSSEVTVPSGLIKGTMLLLLLLSRFSRVRLCATP